MLFQRLIWCALGIAVLLGSAESLLQQAQAVPLILAAEVFEESAAEPASLPPVSETSHQHEGATAHEHEHHSTEWTPSDGFERNAWTWVANVLHGFSMALLTLAVMGLWTFRQGTIAPYRLAFAVAASGWLSLHFWPSLGLPAEIPGMEAAALGARQSWWLLAVLCAAAACATVGFGKRTLRYGVAVALFALPFLIGAPQHTGDALAAFGGDAHARMTVLAKDFFWATTWLSLSFWILMGIIATVVYGKWLQPVMLAQRHRSPAA